MCVCVCVCVCVYACACVFNTISLLVFWFFIQNTCDTCVPDISFFVGQLAQTVKECLNFG